MFSDAKAVSNKKNNKRKGASVRDAAVTILTSGCHFEGKLYCKGTSRIGGIVKGTIISEGLLIIEEEAKLEAKIVVDEIVVLGNVSGELRAKKRIELHPGSVFVGEISSPTLVVREGAQFDGRSTMSDSNKEVELPQADDNREPEVKPDHTAEVGAMPDVAIMDSAG
ncbi:MAG: polymer-forming cytoskeletal protein [Pseudomonadota bacterium]|nr:polymer-forming cytoskeletal protein [Pseudomonadota bacterium]